MCRLNLCFLIPVEQKARVINTQNDVMVGKQVIVIGGGSYRSWSKWPGAASYGIKVRDLHDRNEPSHDKTNKVRLRSAWIQTSTA
jgi:hypothetical protein